MLNNFFYANVVHVPDVQDQKEIFPAEIKWCTAQTGKYIK